MKRYYREQLRTDGLFSFGVQVEESDLFFVCDADVREKAGAAVRETREAIEAHIRTQPHFATSLAPVDVGGDAAPIVKDMAQAAELFGVGPMAAVAGAVAQRTGELLAPHCSHLIVENGGDIYLKSPGPVTIGVYAGESSPFTGALRFRVDPAGGSLGVCTSSGTVGHSLSFGKADAVVAIAARADVADAAATAVANRVRTAADVERVLADELEKGILKGLIIVIDDKMGAWGDLAFVESD